jgi:hypothetical protein
VKTELFFSSKSPHWPTPAFLLKELDEEFHFDFDPCPLGEDEKDGAPPHCLRRGGESAFSAIRHTIAESRTFWRVRPRPTLPFSCFRRGRTPNGFTTWFCRTRLKYVL